MMIVRGTEPPEVSHRNQLSEVNQSQFLTRIEMTTGRVDFFKVLLLFYQTVIWRRLFRGSLLEVFYKKRLRPTTLLKKRLLHRSFPVNFAKFLRTLFLTVNTSDGCFLLLIHETSGREYILVFFYYYFFWMKKCCQSDFWSWICSTLDYFFSWCTAKRRKIVIRYAVSWMVTVGCW